MKTFEVTKTSSRDTKWYHVSRTDFMYDGNPGSYCKMTGDKTNAYYIKYDGHDCLWGVKRGILNRFGKMFDVPKYEDFIDHMKGLFNIEIPTITYDTDKLVVYNITRPQKTEVDGISEVVCQFVFNNIHGEYILDISKIAVGNIIIYDGLTLIITDWCKDMSREFEGDVFPSPKYSDFISQIKDTFGIELPTVNKPNYTKSREIDIDIPSVNKPDTDKLVITDTNVRKNLAKNPNDDYIETVKKFMYKGKEGKCTNVVFGILTENAIEYDNFKTVITEYHHDDGSVRCDINGDRYILPEQSDFVNQIKDAFGVELPTVKREPNKIIILNKTHTCERDIYYTSYKFEFNGKPGTCLIRVGDDINATRITYDGEDKEWGRYYGDWDCTSYTFTDPKYNDFKEAAKEAFRIYDFPNR